MLQINQDAGQDTSAITLTSETIPVMAHTMIKFGFYDDFTSMLVKLANKGPLLDQIKPSQLKKAAEHCVAKEDWSQFVTLAAAVQNSPKLLRALTPDMVAHAVQALTKSPEEHLHRDNRTTEFAKLARAVTSQTRLQGAFTPNMVASVASSLAERMMQTYNYGSSATHTNTRTIYYANTVAHDFSNLVIAALNSPELQVGISPTHIAKAFQTLFGAGQEKVNERQTDIGYATEVGKHFNGFAPLNAFIALLNDTPKEWQQAAAAALEEQIKTGMDPRTMPLMASAAKKAPFLLPADRFEACITHLSEEKKGGNSYTHSLLYHFGSLAHLNGVMPGLIAQNLRTKLEEGGNFGSVTPDSYPGYEGAVHTGARALVREFAHAHDYSAMGPVFHFWRNNSLRTALMEEAAAQGLHPVWVSGHDHTKPELSTLLAGRSTLDVTFRKATADVVIALDPADRGSYRVGAREPRVQLLPLSSAAEIDTKVPPELTALVRHIFAEVLANPANLDTPLPEWASVILARLEPVHT